MRKTTVVAAACGAAVGLVAIGPAAGGAATNAAAPAAARAARPARAVRRPAYAARLRKQIPALMKANAIPGAIVLIQSPRRGNWSATFGTAQLGRRVPMRLTDHFRVGSNTKTMTSTVILQLVQEGRLKLDDPISKFRPDVPNGDNITIAQLSEMRSGLFSYTFDPGFNATLDKQPRKAWTPDELLEIAFSHPADFAPGAEYEYSNTNIVLLGLVIEQLTRMSASEAFQQRIFDPLRMTHSFLPEKTDWRLPAPRPRGYQFGSNVATIDSYAVPSAQLPAALSGRLKPIDNTNSSPSWAWTAGGAISTAGDLARYARALVGGGLLNRRTQRLRLDSIQPIVPGVKGVGYGLGIAEFAPDIIGHDGQLPGYSSFMVHNPKTRETIIFAANLSASPVDGENAAVVVAKGMLETLYGPSILPQRSPSAAR